MTYSERFDPLQGERLEIMDKDERVLEELRPDISDEEIQRLYEPMTTMRAADQMALKRQREGRMGERTLPSRVKRPARPLWLPWAKTTGSSRRTGRPEPCGSAGCRLCSRPGTGSLKPPASRSTETLAAPCSVGRSLNSTVSRGAHG